MSHLTEIEPYSEAEVVEKIRHRIMREFGGEKETNEAAEFENADDTLIVKTSAKMSNPTANPSARSQSRVAEPLSDHLELIKPQRDIFGKLLFVFLIVAFAVLGFLFLRGY